MVSFRLYHGLEEEVELQDYIGNERLLARARRQEEGRRMMREAFLPRPASKKMHATCTIFQTQLEMSAYARIRAFCARRGGGEASQPHTPPRAGAFKH